MKRYIKSAVGNFSAIDREVQYADAAYSTRPDVLAKLAESQDFCVRRAVAKNQNTPIEILEKLARDPQSIVRNALLYNSKAPKFLRDQVQYSLDNKNESNSVELTLYVIMPDIDPNAPAIKKLLTDIETCVRQMGCKYHSIMYLPDFDDEDDPFSNRVFKVTVDDVPDDSQAWEMVKKLCQSLEELGYNIEDYEYERLLNP